MKPRKGRQLVITGLLLYLAGTTGCFYDQVYVAPPERDVSYSTDIQPYFDNKCLSCHNGTGIPLNLEATVSYNELINGDYINTADPAGSKLYLKIAPGGSMEQYSTPSETALVLLWIEQGANNN